MTLRVEFSTGGTATSNVAGSIRRDLPTGGPKFTIKAEEGAVGGSEVYVDDTAGTLNVVGLRRWWAWETGEDPGYQVIATGYIGPREIGRIANGIDDHVVGADRVWTVSLNDHNQLLARRLITGTDGDRPAETDIARITWLIGSSYLSGVDNVLGYINATDTVSLDASDLRGQSAYEVLRDCAQRSGKDFFLVRRGDTSPPTFGGTDRCSLWYDYQVSTAYQSTLRLTNIRADVDNTTTFAVNPDAKLRRVPDRTYSGILVRHVNGSVYSQNTTTLNTFGARDNAVTDSNITTDAAAAALAATYLDNARTEEDRITCRFMVPHTKVNHLREGQAVQVKFSHFGTPYSAGYTYMRCVERTVEQVSDTTYEISVELVGTGTTTFSEAYLESPNSNNIAGGWFRINWDNDGDNFRAGRSLQPLTGLMAYVGAVGERTYLQMLGSGIVSINVHIDCSVVGTGTATNSIRITKNGTPIVQSDHTTGGGLRTVLSEWETAGSPGVLTLNNIAVRYGDLIGLELQFDPTSYTNNPGTAVVPTGTGNIEHQLYVGGYLR